MNKTATIASAIDKNMGKLQKHSAFVEWIRKQSPEKGDVVLINNSFVFRDEVKTNKSNLFVALKFADDRYLDGQIYIAQSPKIQNADFRLVKNREKDGVKLSSLKKSIPKQMQSLGNLVFILIGEIDDSIIIEAPLEHGRFRKLAWNSKLELPAAIDGNTIVVKDTYDEELIWLTIEPHLDPSQKENLEELRKRIGVALDKLQDKARARLVIPASQEGQKNCITCQIVEVLKQQRNEYKQAIDEYAKLKTGTNLDAPLNDILRISYNFASDATTFLRLVVSICDLKPIILWGTIAEHYSLSMSFKALPWLRSNNKPSIKNYTSIIGNARNSAFHNLFPFRKSLEVSLPTSALRDAQLTIFSEFERKKENELKFQDKELIDVLFEFTRARTRRVSLPFWRQNLEVMNKTIDLFESMTGFLWELV